MIYADILRINFQGNHLQKKVLNQSWDRNNVKWNNNLYTRQFSVLFSSMSYICKNNTLNILFPELKNYPSMIVLFFI